MIFLYLIDFICCVFSDVGNVFGDMMSWFELDQDPNANWVQVRWYFCWLFLNELIKILAYRAVGDTEKVKTTTAKASEEQLTHENQDTEN